MLRIYLSGRMTVEGPGAVLGPGDFPGRQGRAAFAYLVVNRERPVSRTSLADALWPDGSPRAWDGALSAVVSKLRSMLTRSGADGPTAIAGIGGTYEVRLPDGSWIDHEAAESAIHEAEVMLAAGAVAEAYGPSAVARLIADRPFLPGEEGDWIDARRATLEDILVRALECRAAVYLGNEEHSLAVASAREAVRLRPFRESAYRLLMRAHAAAGNGAEALRVYEECRALFAEELGVGPSPETRAVHEEVLKGV